MVIGFLTMRAKLISQSKRVEDKVDANTAITKSGTVAATVNAAAAATAAATAANKTDDLAKQMNGELDRRIEKAIKEHTAPVVLLIKEHTEQDDINMRDIRTSLGEFLKLQNYTHEWKHSLLNTINELSLKVDLLSRQYKAD